VRDLEVSDAHELVPLGQRVDIQQDLFVGPLCRSSPTGCDRAPAVEPILLGFRGPRVVLPIPAPHRDLGIVQLHPARGLLEEALDRRLEVPERPVRPVILGSEVREHLWVLRIVQPVVVVDPDVPMRLELVRPFRGTRRPLLGGCLRVGGDLTRRARSTGQRPAE
jgi:hypothetical protein